MKKLRFMIMGLVSMLLGGVATAKAPRMIVGTGTEITETRTAGHFNGVRTSAGIDAIVRQSPDFSVRVSADEAVMPYLKTDVVDGVLVIRYEPSINLSLKKIKSRVYVSAPEIRSLSASSSGDIRIDGTLRGEKLIVEASSSGDVEGRAEYARIEAKASSSGDIKLSGKTDEYSMEAQSSGEIDGHMECVRITATASSSGDIDLSGTAEECILRASSSGDIDFGDLVCRNADVEASSSGDVTVHATEKLNARASSSGSVEYKGNPAVTKSTSSRGTVRRDD